MRRLGWLSAVGAIAVLLLLPGCYKVTGGGQMTCIGPWSEIGLFVDQSGDGRLDYGAGIMGGVEGDRVSFGLNAQPLPRTDHGYDAKGQLQLVDHTQGILLHADIVFIADTGRPGYVWYDSQDVDGVPQATIVTAEGAFPVDYMYFGAGTGRWALINYYSTPDKTRYPEWPYREILDGGVGDTLIVTVYYNDFSRSCRWAGVVENGNITIHPEKDE